MRAHRPTGRGRMGLALTLLAVVLWGMLPVALKITLEQMDAGSITWYRFVTCAVLLGVWLGVRGSLPRLGNRKRHVYALLALVTLGLASNYILYIVGLALISAASAQVIIQLAPALTTLGAVAIFRERFGWLQWVGFLALLPGQALFFHNRLAGIFTGAGNESIGVLLVLGSAVAWAVYALGQKQLLEELPAAGVLLVVYTGSAALLFPVASPSALLRLDLLHMCTLAFCALNTLVAYGCFTKALEYMEASRVTAWFSLTPMATLAMAGIGSCLWPAKVEGEAITFVAFVGACIVVAGSAMIALGRRS